MGIRKCRVCGCTDDDCRGCIEKTGEPCYWVEYDLCSACAGVQELPYCWVEKDVSLPEALAREGLLCRRYKKNLFKKLFHGISKLLSNAIP